MRARYSGALPNGVVVGSATRAVRSWSGASARAPSATARARPGLAKAPTWTAYAASGTGAGAGLRRAAAVSSLGAAETSAWAGRVATAGNGAGPADATGRHGWSGS